MYFQISDINHIDHAAECGLIVYLPWIRLGINGKSLFLLAIVPWNRSYQSIWICSGSELLLLVSITVTMAAAIVVFVILPAPDQSKSFIVRTVGFRRLFVLCRTGVLCRTAKRLLVLCSSCVGPRKECTPRNYCCWYRSRRRFIVVGINHCDCRGIIIVVGIDHCNCENNNGVNY